MWSVDDLLRTARLGAKVVLGREPWLRPSLHCRTEFLGSDYGGWTLCPDGLGADSVFYCFGIGFDVSFDLALIERFGGRVHGFDPTPRCLAWLQTQSLPEAFEVHPLGLAGHDGELAMVPPEDPSHVSFSSLRATQGVSTDVECLQVRRLSTLARALGHDHIDLLKLDIEGSEYEALPDLLHSGPSVRQLLIEFHHRQHPRRAAVTREAVQRLRVHGFELFAVSRRNEEFSFLNTRR
ncbi:MAG: FkbM family methyltransferase [Pseudomonadota bacterium]